MTLVEYPHVESTETRFEAAGNQEEWREPLELPDLPSVDPFHEDLLPASLRPWLVDAADRAQCPIEYLAAAAVVAGASVLGRGCGIRPKRHDDWTVVPNLWGAVVGGPASMKTPACEEGIRFVSEMASKSAEEYEGRSYDRLFVQARRAECERAMKNPRNADLADLRLQYEEIEDQAAAANKVRRFITNDPTVEKMGELLRDSGRGLMLYRDELVGFFRTLDKQGHENDRSFFLTAWNGTSDYVYDRIGRGTCAIRGACVSILGGIQPGPLGTYLRAAMDGGAGDDGLMQRFQVLMFPDARGPWRHVDRAPDLEAREVARRSFTRLAHATAKELGAIEDASTLVPYVHFDDDAQRVFNEWWGALENRARTCGEHPAVQAHLLKYRSLLPSLALLFHMLDGGCGQVTRVATERAIAWCALLEQHMRRVYAVVAHSDFSGAKTILAKIKAGELGTTFTVRELKRKQWTGLSDQRSVVEALQRLVEYGWVRTVVVQTGGRSSEQVLVHPDART